MSKNKAYAQQLKDMGDEQSRCLMNLDPGEMYCLIHYDLLPIIVENLQNIQTGLAM